jgi:hypothetical protein
MVFKATFNNISAISWHTVLLMEETGFSGIQLNIQVKTRQLTLSATVPEEFKGEVTGLMGNFDGDKTNEYILPNGTIKFTYLLYPQMLCEFHQKCINRVFFLLFSLYFDF